MPPDFCRKAARAFSTGAPGACWRTPGEPRYDSRWIQRLSRACGRDVDTETPAKLEQQWGNVVLLIVDEVSFIGRAFFARMHFRLQQAKRGFFAEANVDPNACQLGDLSIILVGDFGQLEPIDDWSMCDDAASWQRAPRKWHTCGATRS